MKERLTGAIILVALIVLLVPELLTGPPRSAGAAMAMGASEERPLRSYTINLTDDRPRSGDSAAASSMPQLTGGEGGAMPAPSGPLGNQVASPTHAAVGVGTPSAAAASGSTMSGSTASTASDSTVATAATAASGSKAAPTGTASAIATPSQKASDAASRSTPQRAAAARQPAGPPVRAAGSTGGWGVQLGVFASRENAERLAQEMRGKGFKASVSDVSSSARKLFKVRVGPAADRAAAQSLQSRLRAAGRSGTIVPYS